MKSGGYTPMTNSTKVRFAFKRRRPSTQRRLVVEQLESRLALSPLHGADPLFILGTDGPDDIGLTYDSTLAQIRVTDADRLIGTFSLHELSSVQIDAGHGDDRIEVEPSLPLPVNVIGGDGNDTLIGVRLQSGQEVLFTSGERLAFDNVSCVTVECLRSPEGEGSTTGQTPSAATVFPPGLGMVDHSQDMPVIAFVSPGDLTGSSQESATVQDRHEQEMQARILTAGNVATETRPSSDALASFSRTRDIPRRATNTPEQSVEPAPAPQLETESESVLPATGEMKDNIDAVLSGWTEGEGTAGEGTAKSDTSGSDTSANPKSTVEDVSADQMVLGAPDVASTAAQRTSVAGNRNWIVAVAMAFALVIGAAAFFLDRRAARLRAMTESRTDSDI